MTENLNVKEIAAILQKNKTSEAFATYAACRERNVRDGVSKLPAIRLQMAKEGFLPVPRDLFNMFKDLAKAGIGELQGKTFKWNVPIKAVGEAAHAAPKTGVVAKPVRKDPKEVPTLTTRVEKHIAFSLGAGRDMQMTFTPNLTAADCDFIHERLLKECKG